MIALELPLMQYFNWPVLIRLFFSLFKDQVGTLVMSDMAENALVITNAAALIKD